MTKNKFRIITGSSVREHDKKHICKFINKKVKFTDITDDYSCFGIFGPKSRNLLTKLIGNKFTNEQFPFGSGKTLNYNGIAIWFQRLSYVGELGWELYIPINNAKRIYEKIIKEGKNFNLVHAGAHAMDIMRMEKGLSYTGDTIYLLEKILLKQAWICCKIK